MLQKKLSLLLIAVFVIEAGFGYASSSYSTRNKTPATEVIEISAPPTVNINERSVITIKYLENRGWSVITQEGYDVSDDKTYPASDIQGLQPWLETQLGPLYKVIVDETPAFTPAHLDELTDNYDRLQADYVTLAGKQPAVIEVPVEVENVVTIKKNITPHYFSSEDEAKGWIADHHLPVVVITDASGQISLNNPQPDSRYDCDDYAKDFVQLALQDGFLLYEAPVVNGAIWNVPVTNRAQNHVGVMARIQNAYYYIETSPGPYQWHMVKILDAD